MEVYGDKIRNLLIEKSIKERGILHQLSKCVSFSINRLSKINNNTFNSTTKQQQNDFRNYFITGANRGIVFELVKKYSDEGAQNFIIPTARNVEKAVELKALAEKNKNVQIIQLDVADSESIATLDSFWEEHFYTNTLGPILVYQKLHKLLLKRTTRKVIFTSTIAASITSFFPTSTSAYGQSKAALNYSVKELSFELKADKFTVVAVHPGTVATEMGNFGVSAIKKNNPEFTSAIDASVITSEQSPTAMKKLFDDLKEEQSGFFWSYDGSEIPF
ncbi:uncharacterized protein RJT20DRAFT_148381 [Scheffersomyces xylosifermentans]|uniref:uncharacterized protein n=1 Tax=Scheffersomyces xylosifermentans TaxID=1304137 RepID=UPI00315CBFC6